MLDEQINISRRSVFFLMGTALLFGFVIGLIAGRVLIS